MVEAFNIETGHLTLENTNVFDAIYQTFRNALSKIEDGAYLPSVIDWKASQINPDHGVYLNVYEINKQSSYSWVVGKTRQHEPYTLDIIIKSYLHINLITKMYNDFSYHFALFIEYYDGKLDDTPYNRNHLKITLISPHIFFNEIKTAIQSIDFNQL